VWRKGESGLGDDCVITGLPYEDRSAARKNHGGQLMGKLFQPKKEKKKKEGGST